MVSVCNRSLKLPHQADELPDITTQAMIDAGQHPARSALAVSSTWNNCDATMQSVEVATKASPESVSAIVGAVASGEGCGCSGDSMWSLSRLEQRLRPEIQPLLVQLGDVCTCVTAAVEAAVEAAPDRAEQVIRAGIEAMQSLPEPEDSVGRRAEEFGQSWGALAAADNKLAWFRRKHDICEGDKDFEDDFVPTEYWDGFEASMGSDAGLHENECDDFEGLIISEFSVDHGLGSYVEIHNGTGQDVNLGQEKYRLSVNYLSDDQHTHTIPLQGVIKDGESFVMAAGGLASSLGEKVDLAAPGLSIRGGDAFSLHKVWSDENCGCARAVAAGARRGSENEGGLAAVRQAAGDSGLSCSSFIVEMLEYPEVPILYVTRPTTPGVDPIVASPN